jgi:dCTP deaminase
MFLNHRALLNRIRRGDVSIDPFDPRALKSASYVLRLGSRFRRWRSLPGAIEAWREPTGEELLEPVLESPALCLSPGEFVLGQTAERVRFGTTLAGMLSPLSHVARFGIGIHGGADWINPGFGLNAPSFLTLELYNYNSNSVCISAGMPICHLRVAETSAEGWVEPYQPSIYDGSDPLIAPKMYEELRPLFTSQEQSAGAGRPSYVRHERWPPHCCVPAFLHAALKELGHADIDPAKLATKIGVKVGPLDSNPFGLQVVESATARGVLPSVAVRTINVLLGEINSDFAFRHLRFNEIACDGEFEVLETALRRQLIVGVGLDYSHLDSSVLPQTRHLMRISRAVEHDIELADDFTGGIQMRRWDHVELASKALLDGFWLIGPRNQLQFPLSPVWVPPEPNTG